MSVGDNDLRRHRRRVGLVGLATLAVFLAGCGGIARKPDLQRLYASARESVDQPPAILIPGIMGTRLLTADGDEHWPGSIWKAAFSNYRGLALPFEADPPTSTADLVPGGLTDEVAGRDYYASIVHVLEWAGGYRRGIPGRPAEPGRRYLYEFGYDWRQDNVESARRLDALIERIRLDHGRPDLKVDLIAHSMGGLIARYYLRYGTADVLDDNDFPVNYHGGSRVRRVALLGTPNLGSVDALRAFIVGRRIGLGRIPTETLITFPSMYQLFPHPLNDWIATAEGTVLDRDIFDIQLWRRFQWSIFDPGIRERIHARHSDPGAAEAYLARLEGHFFRHVERGRRFVWSLTVPLERVPWTMTVFGGDCELTPARLLVEEVEGESLVRLRPKEILRPLPGIDYGRLMLEPGDGTVTKASLLARESLDPFVPRHRYISFPVRGAMFLCERHDRLAGNISFQDNLLHFLLSRDEDHAPAH